MKRIIVLASLLAISMNTGFAAILGSASSDIDTLRAQGFSESTLKVVDLVRYNNRGMNGTYERRFITKEGNGRAKTNAYIAGKGVDVGADIFARGLCLPSDNKMTVEEQEKIIEIVKSCFE